MKNEKLLEAILKLTEAINELTKSVNILNSKPTLLELLPTHDFTKIEPNHVIPLGNPNVMCNNNEVIK